MPELTDWRGTKIEVGDLILYAVKHSTSVEVNEGIVSGFGTGQVWYGDNKPTILVDWVRSSEGDWAQKNRLVRKVTLTNTGAVTVLLKASMR